jgi:putative CRISPR-associated protein (TIGR02619 family)
MEKYFHVISTGTSILQNFVRNNTEFAKKYRMEDWYRLKPFSQQQKYIEPYIAKGNEVHEALLKYVSENPKKASAELNSFLTFIETYGHRKEDIEFLLYSTDTNNNRLCAQIIYEYLISQDFRAAYEVVVVKDFGRDFEAGLVNLMERVIRIIKKKSEQKYRVYINATAGYKLETSFLVIASMLTLKKRPIAYYQHEAFDEPIIVPSLPITVDENLLKIAEMFEMETPVFIAREKLARFDLNPDDLDVIYPYCFIRNTDKGTIKTREWLITLLKILKT